MPLYNHKRNSTLENGITSNWSYFPSQMAISAIPFLIANGQPARKFAYFSILSTVLVVFEIAYCSLSSYPISFLRASSWPFKDPSQGATYRCPIQIIYNNNFPSENRVPWPASLLTSFSIKHTSFHFRKASRSGGRKPSRKPPGASSSKRWMRVGRSLPVRGEGDSPAH